MNVKEEIKLNNYSFIIGDEVKHNLCFFVKFMLRVIISVHSLFSCIF